MRDINAYRRWSIQLCSVIVLLGGSLLVGCCGGGSQTADMTAVRSGHTATLLDNGQVLVTGGMDSQGNPLATAELYH